MKLKGISSPTPLFRDLMLNPFAITVWGSISCQQLVPLDTGSSFNASMVMAEFFLSLLALI